MTGEIRRVTRIEQRINEAAKLGFTKIYAPKNSLHGMTIPEGIQVVGVTTVGEVLKKSSLKNLAQKRYIVSACKNICSMLYFSLRIGRYL